MNELPSTLFEFVGAGGFVMPPLILGTLVLWWALGWRLMTLQRGTSRSVHDLIEAHQENEGPPARGIIDAAVRRGLSIARSGVDNTREHIEESYFDFREQLHRHEALVKSIVIVAPLAGLLGTVTGMIETFDSLGDMSLFSQSGGIAGGISQALISTQMGLAVAIPGLIVGRILDKRALELEDELDRVRDIICTSELLDGEQERS